MKTERSEHRPVSRRLAFVALSILGLAMPLAAAAPAQDEDPAERAYIGVYISDAEQGGVEISGSIEGLPGARAGLRAGDRILAIDGKEIENTDTLAETMAGYRPGQEIRLRIERAGEVHELPVTLGSRRPPAARQSREAEEQGELAQRWRERLEQHEERAREWAESFQGGLEKMRRDLEERRDAARERLPEIRRELEQRAAEDPHARELLRRIMGLHAESQRWHEEHLRELGRAQERMRQGLERHLGRLRSLGGGFRWSPPTGLGADSIRQFFPVEPREPGSRAPRWFSPGIQRPDSDAQPVPDSREAERAEAPDTNEELEDLRRQLQELRRMLEELHAEDD